MSNNMLSAGVYENIIDESFIVDGTTPMSAGVVISADRGPIGPNVIRSANEFAAQYGLPSRDNPSMYAAMRFLRHGQFLTVSRLGLDAVTATGALVDSASGDPHLEVEAANPGAWGNAISVQFADVIGVDSADGVFAVIVLENGEQVERFEVSRDPDARDGFGVNIFIEEMINGRSRYIRVQDNPTITADYDKSASITLSGGANASVAPTSTDIADAWEEFKNEEAIQAKLLINAGFTADAVQIKMIEVAEYRADCRAILDVPQNTAESVSDMIAWRTALGPSGGLGISSNRAAMYGGWLRIHDSYSNREITIPPSGDVAAVIARIFRDNNPWDAPAGTRRGVLNALGTSKRFTQEERDDLYIHGINPVTSIGGNNAVVWGQKTLQREKSALDRLGVVNNVLWITERLKSSLHPYVFEANTQFVRDNVNYILTQFLEGVQTRGGLYAFRVDTETANTPDVIDNNQFIVNVWIQPVRHMEFIRLNVTVTPTGIDLEAV